MLVTNCVGIEYFVYSGALEKGGSFFDYSVRERFGRLGNSRIPQV